MKLADIGNAPLLEVKGFSLSGNKFFLNVSI